MVFPFFCTGTDKNDELADDFLLVCVDAQDLLKVVMRLLPELAPVLHLGLGVPCLLFDLVVTQSVIV